MLTGVFRLIYILFDQTAMQERTAMFFFHYERLMEIWKDIEGENDNSCSAHTL